MPVRPSVRLLPLLALAAALLAGDAVAQTRPVTRQPTPRTPLVRPRQVDVLPAPGQRPTQQTQRPFGIVPPSPGQSRGPSPGVQRQTAASAALAPTLTALGDELAAVSDHIEPTVVHIFSQKEGGGAETGSGVLMRDVASSRGGGAIVVTNRHVVAGAPLTGIAIRLSDGRELQPIEKAEDAQTDLAVLRLRETNLPTAEWADSDGLRIGHFVIAAGSPFGLQQSITLGIVSAKGRRALDLSQSRNTVINQDFIQTDAAINPGNSGGPLFDMSGRVVGINTAIASKSGGNDGIGFSIPSRLAQYVAGQLLRHGLVRRGYLGVELNENFTAADARRLQLLVARGAHISRVKSGSPADRATLLPDDVVVEFDGRPVEDERHLVHLVSLTPPNRAVALTVVRRGRRVPLQVRLSERRPQTAETDEPSDAPRIGAVPQATPISR